MWYYNLWSYLERMKWNVLPCSSIRGKDFSLSLSFSVDSWSKWQCNRNHPSERIKWRSTGERGEWKAFISLIPDHFPPLLSHYHFICHIKLVVSRDHGKCGGNDEGNAIKSFLSLSLFGLKWNFSQVAGSRVTLIGFGWWRKENTTHIPLSLSLYFPSTLFPITEHNLLVHTESILVKAMNGE